VHNSVRHRNARLIPAGLLLLGTPGASEVSLSGELSEVFVENAQGPLANRSSCGSAECAQACGACGVAAPLELVSGGGGVAARVGDVACMQLSPGEINKHKDAGPTGGGWELVECGGQRGASCGVVSGLEAGVAGRGSQVSEAVFNE
jgi:hypothetical protein